MALKTNYKDDIFTGDYRKYRQINNSDGTISLSDVTQYSQTGDKFGASDINATNQAVNQLNSDLGAKVAGFTSGSYTKVTGLAYDSTNKKLGLKVNGADTVIPFSGGVSFDTLVLPGSYTSSAGITSIVVEDNILDLITSADSSSFISNLKNVGLFSDISYNSATQTMNYTVTKHGYYSYGYYTYKFGTHDGIEYMSAGSKISVGFEYYGYIIYWGTTNPFA